VARHEAASAKKTASAARPRPLPATRANQVSPASDTFGVISRDGVIRTFYKPNAAVHGYQPIWSTLVLNSGNYACPVCGFDGLDEPAYDVHGCASFGICPCCGVEFGYEDASQSHLALRAEWVQRGMPWWSKAQLAPANWDPEVQLRRVSG
jgi:hypothetical protein